MKIVGLWPEPDDGVVTKLRGWFSACLIILIIYLPQSASVYCYWGNMDAVIECLSINGPVLITIVKIIIFRYNRKGELRINFIFNILIFNNLKIFDIKKKTST